MMKRMIRMVLAAAGMQILLAVFIPAQVLIHDSFDDGNPLTNTTGTGTGWTLMTRGPETPTESGGALKADITTVDGITGLTGNDVINFWDEDGVTISWEIKDITIATPHAFNAYFAYCWEVGITSTSKGGFYFNMGKKDNTNAMEIWMYATNKTFTGSGSGQLILYPEPSNPRITGRRWTATFPVVFNLKVSSTGWAVTSNQSGLAPFSGNWTTDMQVPGNDASITTEFVNGAKLRVAGRNHGIDNVVTTFPANTGRMEYVTVTRNTGTVTTRAPYGGTAAVIPGKIEAEDFDTGGEGVAYHDVTTANQGGAYRTSEGVDIEAGAGGYTLGFVSAGEWTEYTVDVAAAGTYDIGLRVANAGDGGKMHIEFDGTDKTGTVNVPNTGGWTAYQTVTVSGVSLSAGEQVMRISFDTASNAAGSGVANIDYLNLSVSGSTGIDKQPRRNTPAAGMTGAPARIYDVNGRMQEYPGAIPAGIYLRETGGIVRKVYLTGGSVNR